MSIVESSIVQIHNLTKKELITIISEILDVKLELLKAPKKSPTVSVKDASELLGVSELTIRNYIKRGLIPASKIGRRIVIKRVDIEKSLSEVKSLKYKRG